MEAVLFDMDGVLVDSELQWKLAEKTLFARLVPAWREEDHERIVGLGVLDLYDFFARDYGLAVPREEFLRSCDAVAEEVYLRRVRLAEGALDLLHALRRERIPAALVSSSPRAWIRMTLERFGLAPCFRATAGADDVGGEGKPSPAVYLHATGALGIRPGNCLAIEDSAIGVLAARRAGARVAAFRNGSNDGQDLSGADAEIRGFAGLSPDGLRRLAWAR